MLKRVRFFLSATLIAVLLVSTLILFKPAPVKACPDPPPATLLSLYLRSDLIFTANLTGEKDGKILTDEEDYFYIEVIRNLKVSSVLKGKPERNFAFTEAEYRYKKTAEESTNETGIEYFPYGYKGNSKIKVDEKYLFFFKKDAETGQYALTDEVSGYKKLSDADLYIHKKRIDELKSIVKTKENQLEAITGWLIRLIEEPATRWDGVFDLNASFEAVEYDDEESEEMQPFVIDENFYSSTPEIARNLSDSQKEYISSIAFSSIQQEMSGGGFYYGLSNLVRHWDKSRLTMFAFSFLQTVDKSDAEKTKEIMEYLSNLLDDEELSELSSEYPVDDSSEKTEEIIEQETEVINESENKTEEVIEVAQNTEQNTETQIKTTEEAEPETKKLTPAQKREEILQKFINRYEYLLARGFPVENGEELAEN